MVHRRAGQQVSLTVTHVESGASLNVGGLMLAERLDAFNLHRPADEN